MKRLITRFSLLLFIMAFLNTPAAYATHLMGGNISHTYLGNNEYLIELYLYRDCNGINLNTTANIELVSPTCGNLTETVNLLSGYPIAVTPLCPSEPDRCIVGFGLYGQELFVYQDTITLPGCFSSASDITISYSNCCRNNSITTLNVTGGTYLYVNLDASQGVFNQSPQPQTQIPLPIVSVNQPVSYSFACTNLDQDSLVYSLTDCLSAPNTSVLYNSPYSGTHPLSTTNGVSIDSTTGIINFTANAVQIAPVCVLVEEYRNGVKIGETIIDRQFAVVNNPFNDYPVLSGINGTADSTRTTGSFVMTACVGDSINFTITLMTKISLIR